MIIDSHCHLHDRQYFTENREEVYRRCIESGTTMIVVGTSQADSRDAVEYAESHDGVFAVIGVHPHDTKDGWLGIKTLLDNKPSKLVGIGEVGLDYFHENSPREVQIRALEEHLQWANDYDLPVSFHIREAFDDFWPIFDGFHGIRGVLHSFTDTQGTLDEGLKRGLYIGVNGISTFTKDASQQAMFKNIPLERLLLETDSPYLTPVPFRGKVNEPAFVMEVAKHQSNIRSIPLDDIAAITTANADALFAF